MGTRTVVEFICDTCEAGEAETHELIADGKTVEVDSCPECWDQVTRVLASGRRKRRKRTT